jgi:hypothetical protein
MFGRKAAAERRREAEAFNAQVRAEIEADRVKDDILDLTREPPVRITTHLDGRVEYRRIDRD